MLALLPGFSLVLDIMPVLENLWAAAQALHGVWKSEACRAYVRRQLKALLAGQTEGVIDYLARKAAVLCDYGRAPVDAAIRYFTRNAPYMRYKY